MNASPSHYLLFSESRIDCKPGSGRQNESECAGQWRFVLEKADGSVRLEADDAEPEIEDEHRLELLAVVRGLEALNEPSRVTLVTRSRYVTRGFRYRLAQWRENDWCWERYGEMTPVRNSDLWRRVDEAMRYHHVECRVWRFDPPESRSPSRPKSAVAQPAVRASSRRAATGSPSKSHTPLERISRVFHRCLERATHLIRCRLVRPVGIGLGTQYLI
jgi:ribonuclease HI